LALALVPLVGAGWFAYNEIDEVTHSRRQAEEVADSVRELVLLNELQTAVLDEYTWAVAFLGAADIGIDISIAKDLLGIDFEIEFLDAVATVDDRMAEIGWTEFEVGVTTLRANTDLAFQDVGRGYEALIATVEVRAEQSLDRLLAVAGEISSGGDLVATVRVLEASTRALQAVSQQLTGYFGTQFSSFFESPGSLQALTEQRGEYDSAIAQVERMVAAGSETDKVLAATQRSDAVVLFRAEVDQLVDMPPEGGAGMDIAGLLAQLDTIAASFEAAAGSVAAHAAVVDAAGADVEVISLELDDAAAAASRRAMARIALLVAASLLFALGLARAIGRPLRQLAGGARELRDGASMSALRPSGPKEVREAMLAINEAAAHLELAGRQASALALGELESPALTETAPGSLGRSLHTAVQTLAASLSASEELQHMLSHEATHDSLTQLSNRADSLTQLGSGLERTSRRGSLMAVMFLDLDGFKQINDRYGHSAGDTVLRVVSERLRDAVRAGDHIGRLGGDEFLIVAEPVDSPAAATALAERVAAEVEQPITLGSKSVEISVCIGVAIADRHTTLTASELLHDADLALYKAKGLGKARIELCDDSLHAEVVGRSQTEVDLQHGLEHDELVLHYQPIVDANNGRLVSLEALVRWQRPGIGLTFPPEFIPVAERSNLIVAVDKWVVRHVAQQIATWADHEQLADIPIAINVSGRHLTTDYFVGDILEPIRQLGVDPARLVLEVTESAVLRDFGAAARNLQLLRDQGVRIAIDDFGTGYTSLEHLRVLPVDILKIDRTFTSDTTATSLLKLIIDTGHLLGIRITAEGIETPEQAAHLLELGSDELQGYLFGRPTPPNELDHAEALLTVLR
jgi:diguanylate cyclase (GGDEF)-like protein